MNRAIPLLAPIALVALAACSGYGNANDTTSAPAVSGSSSPTATPYDAGRPNTPSTSNSAGDLQPGGGPGPGEVPRNPGATGGGAP